MTTETISIRRASPPDAEALARLSEDLGYEASTEETARRLERVTERADHEVLAAVNGSGEIVGWVHVFAAHRVESASFAELGGLVVGSAHRRRGIGGLLISAAEETAREIGVGKLRIRSRVERAEAHRFFENRGFEIVKSQRVYEKLLKETDTRKKGVGVD